MNEILCIDEFTAHDNTFLTIIEQHYYNFNIMVFELNNCFCFD